MAPSSIILPSDNFDDLFEEDDLFGGYGGAFPAIPGKYSTVYSTYLTTPVLYPGAYRLYITFYRNFQLYTIAFVAVPAKAQEQISMHFRMLIYRMKYYMFHKVYTHLRL